MKIYYAHSIKGAHTDWERSPQDIIPLLQQSSHKVLSESFFSGKEIFDKKFVYTRDTEMIRESDIILANISNPSLWVGYEIGYAEALGKKIICFYQTSLNNKISGMITWNPSFQSYPIHSLNEIIPLL
jgi:nucleoside 2-deoxyribosyltransferase